MDAEQFFRLKAKLNLISKHQERGEERERVRLRVCREERARDAVLLQDFQILSYLFTNL